MAPTAYARVDRSACVTRMSRAELDNFSNFLSSVKGIILRQFSQSEERRIVDEFINKQLSIFKSKKHGLDPMIDERFRKADDQLKILEGTLIKENRTAVRKK